MNDAVSGNHVYVVMRWYQYDGQYEQELVAAFEDEAEAREWAKEAKEQNPRADLGRSGSREYRYYVQAVSFFPAKVGA